MFLDADGTTDVSPDVELTDGVASITSLGGDTAVLADPDGDLVLATPRPGGAARHRRARRRRQRLARGPPAARRRGPDRSWPPRRTVGSSPSRSPAPRPTSPRSASSPGSAPTAPIAFGGCVFAISTAPATFSQWCADGAGGWTEVQQAPLDGAGSELRLRLVNGWVWINDVDTGAAWVTSPQQRLDRVEDWGAVLSRLDADESDDNTDERGRRGHHRGRPGRPERRDRAVRRDRRGGPEPAAHRP